MREEDLDLAGNRDSRRDGLRLSGGTSSADIGQPSLNTSMLRCQSCPPPHPTDGQPQSGQEEGEGDKQYIEEPGLLPAPAPSAAHARVLGAAAGAFELPNARRNGLRLDGSLLTPSPAGMPNRDLGSGRGGLANCHNFQEPTPSATYAGAAAAALEDAQPWGAGVWGLQQLGGTQLASVGGAGVAPFVSGGCAAARGPEDGDGAGGVQAGGVGGAMSWPECRAGSTGRSQGQDQPSQGRCNRRDLPVLAAHGAAALAAQDVRACQRRFGVIPGL